MWDFSEKDIERFLARPQPGDKNGAILLSGGRRNRFRVLKTQVSVQIMEGSQKRPQPPLFDALREFREFLPRVEGKEQVIDILAWRPASKAEERPKELVVFEVKKTQATSRDVAQVIRYINLVSYHLQHDIGGFRGKLGLRRGKWRVRGILLAPSIPATVWLATTSLLHAKSVLPDIELYSYHIDPDPSRPKIVNIRFANITQYYIRQLRRAAKRYRTQKKPLSPGQLQLGLEQMVTDEPDG